MPFVTALHYVFFSMEGRCYVERPGKGLEIGIVLGVGGGHGNYDGERVFFLGGGRFIPKFNF